MDRKDIARDLARRYGTLSPEQLDALAEIISPMKVKKGGKLLRAGEVCEYIYYVSHGMLRQVYTKNGKELTEHIAYEGGIVMCLESLFRHTPSQLSVEALEPTELYAIPYMDFMSLARSAFSYCAILMSIFQESLIISQKKADTLRMESAKERYLRTLQDHPDIVRRAPLRIVASYLQITPETLSRVRTQLREE
jgi:CRP-like cAMP-binding protein